MKGFSVCLTIFVLFLSSCSSELEFTARSSSQISVTKQEDRLVSSKNIQAKLSIKYDIVERYLSEASRYYPVNIIRTERTDLRQVAKSVTSAELKKCRDDLSGI